MATFSEKLMITRHGVTYSDIRRKIRQRATSGVIRQTSAKNWLDGHILRIFDKKRWEVTFSDIL